MIQTFLLAFGGVVVACGLITLWCGRVKLMRASEARLVGTAARLAGVVLLGLGFGLVVTAMTVVPAYLSQPDPRVTPRS